METSPFIRFRIDRELAERAYQMAAAQGLGLPDVMRMMLTKAVRTGDFAIDRAEPAAASTAPDPLSVAYEPRYWADVKTELDAETALAALHHSIAQGTTTLDEGLGTKAPDLPRLEQVRSKRDEACSLLASFDPKDTAAVASVLQRFAPAPAPGPSVEGPA